jgi:B12-binding domain/radical SAM domain protein
LARPDLVLLHAPSVYDFREKNILYGPVSDVVPSTQIFDMYPIGFMTILSYLEAHGYSVRIVNVALRMLQSRRFDAEKLIRRLRPAAFGIDLHWMVHAQGSLELASIVKKYHPDTPVIFGGLSSSYFHRELIRLPQVDYVIRGDCAEEPLRRLLSAIRERRAPEDVPNLTRMEGDEVRAGELTHVPPSLDEVSFDYRSVMRACARHWDIMGHMPFKAWLGYPILAALTCHGCSRDCVICGGSASFYRRECGRDSLAMRGPQALARDIGTMSRCVRAPIMVLGGLMQAGEEYALAVLSALKAERVRNHVAIEFFLPPPRRILEALRAAIPDYNIQISPESHDEDVRRGFGKPYDNETLERSVFDALDLNCRRLDVFFMIGLPGQTADSVRGTVEYCRGLLGRCREAGLGGRLRPFISPLSPFLDPGSRAFEEPEKHGYRLFHRTLEEHRRALLAPSWKYTLNYETEWMSRDQLVDVTYEAALELNAVKLQYGLLKPEEAAGIAARIARERELMAEIDRIWEGEEEPAREAALRGLMAKFDALGPGTTCMKDEMNWPRRFLRFSPLQIVRSAWSGLLGRRPSAVPPS